MEFVAALITTFESNANSEEAVAMQTYMKNRLPFYGIKAPVRKQLLKEIANDFKERLTHNNAIKIATALYKKPKRELHYCAMEIVARFLKKNYEIEDINFIKKLITTHSWWDTVDFIAKHILGNYLLQFPEQIPNSISGFSASENMWLNRSAILFQLGYKDKTDAALLFSLCEQHKSSNEFFIKKAIGWALREYSKVNPEAVKTFVSNAALKPLSEKEALKKIN